ncbi:TPA: methyltransferase domain-containing protein [Candidatus Gracilibacteria bacterium]|nr:methyltransferase domain-containing protein [Candidatus Gracilibacteria bacterium]
MAKKTIPKKFWADRNISFEEMQKKSRTEIFAILKQFGEKQNIPNISWIGVNVLQFFLQLQKPKKVLEMGSANGFSSCIIADQLEKWDGKLLTGDVSEPSLESAQLNAEICNLQNIEFRFGNILQTIKKEDGPFDFVFIDAQKSWTHKFFMFAETLLSENGIIVVDDTQKFPDKMKSFHNHITREKDNWNWFTVPESDDAIMVFTRKKRENKKEVL